MAGKPRRIPCAACGKKFEQKDKRRKYCSKVCSGNNATPRGEDSPLFKAGQFTAEARAKRKKQRAKWRAIAKAVRAGKIDALEIARMEYADALDRWKELHELSEHKPDLLVDRALASAPSFDGAPCRMTWRSCDMNRFYVYILLLANQQLYTGFTADLEGRVAAHRNGKVASTRGRRPLELLHAERYYLESDARRRERFLKTTEGKRLLRRQLRDVLSQKGVID